MGALAITGIPAVKAPFEPLVPGAIKIQNTNRYRCHDCAHLNECTLRCADDLALRIEMEGPETVAAVFLEPLQNTGGALAPPPDYFEKVREICDRYGILLVADEVICAFGRLGEWFGSARYNCQPDMITFAKGVTSGYAPMGGLIVHNRLAEPFLDDANSFLHGMTFAGHPVSCAVAMANLDIMEDEDVCGNA
jgi:adenosylmethionine-8-amino-7-oxononanoate aminotransferase